MLIDHPARWTLGGSEAASAVGIDPYRSQIALWAEKRGLIQRMPSEAMVLGTLLQPAVAWLVTERHGYETMPAPAEGFTHPTYRWMTGHPDGFAVVNGTRAVLEVKTRGNGWKDDTEALGPYWMQLHHYMAVTGLEVGLLAVLHGGYGGLTLDVREVPRDDSLIAAMIEHEQDFMELLRSDEPPPPDGSDSARETLRALFPGADVPTQVRADQELWKRHVLPARELAETIRVAKQQQERHLQAIQAAMGDATELVSPWDEVVARWTPYTTNRVDTKALRATHPALASEYTVGTPARRFALDG